MNGSDKTELNRILSCLHIALEELGAGNTITTGQCVTLATEFQKAMHADGMTMMWQFDVDRAAAALELEAGTG